MSQEKENNINRVVHVEKEGFPPRTFTLQQLKAMGEDPGGESFDGWKIVDKPQTPPEISDEAKEKAEAAKQKAEDDKALKAKEKADKAAAKKGTPVIPIVSTTNQDSHESTGEKQESGERDGVDSERETLENSAQGSEGDEQVL